MSIGKHAVVIGAGMGGLTAAHALVGKFEKIVVLERDVLPTRVQARPGVPQGRLPHVLLPGGLAALNQLFDGFSGDLHAAGAKESDFGMSISCNFPGQGPLPERALGIPLIKCSRPLIESVVRKRVEQQKDIAILDGRRVTEIVATADGSAVRAVRCETREGVHETHEAELVIDASGRGEPTLGLMRAAGRAAPDETTIGVDLHYASVLVTFPKGKEPRYQTMVTFPNAPESSRTGIILAREDDYVFAGLSGRGDDAPPDDWPDFVEFMGTLGTDSLHDTLLHAKPHGKVDRFMFPESRRRHFERCVNWPRGLVPFADSICRFNPVYGQGMTAGAKEAVMLRELLASRGGHADPLMGLFEAFMAVGGPMLDNIWALSAMPDLAYPDARGERPDNLQEALGFQTALQRAAFLDEDIHRLLLEVFSLLKPASAFNDEAIVEKIKRLAAQFDAARDNVQA
ncbi:FAD-dependent oxidoreductase [Paraburkholderia humisilvae]|uniref:Epoxidase LasC n=1 Tax=Paraburkholderia humisilvae TaxID=627669 RepID=A0A6J5ERZ9_9BURK|nr:hypothetical protein [Paraburkholderia humisilvae]CAB3769338.1 Putative epoxidase LasC [Paraburkholderia humisilvae]